MALKILYADNSSRIINLSDNFYIDKKEVLAEKIERLCGSMGIVYSIELRDGEKVLYDRTVEINQPEVVKKQLSKISQRRIRKHKRERIESVKAYKKEITNKVFTTLYRQGKTIVLEERRLQSKERRDKHKLKQAA